MPGRVPAVMDIFASPTIRAYSRAAGIIAIGAGIGCILFFLLLPTLIVLPMSLSETDHIELGVALYLAFSPLQLTGSFFGFLIAHTVLAIPYVIITVTASLQRFDPTLELAALNCGANRLQAFFLVVLPNIVPGVAAAAVFAFLASFDEATVAFFISDIGGKSIGRKMFEDIDFNLTPVIAAVSTVLVATSLLLMGAVHLLNARKPRS
jgi:mannopine transport system permease protein